MLSVLLLSRPWQPDRASLVVEKEGNPWTLQCTSQKAPDVNPGMIGLCQISCSYPSSAVQGPSKAVERRDHAFWPSPIIPGLTSGAFLVVHCKDHGLPSFSMS